MIGRHQQIGKIFWTFTLSTGADAFPTFDSHSRSFSLRVNESLYRRLTLAGLVSHCILITIYFSRCVSPGQWDWRQPANWIRRVSEVLCLSEGSWAYNWSVYFRPPQKYSKVDPWIMCGYVPFFDIWHVARSITKKLLKTSKEKGCEIIAHWIRGIRKHLYWCATSTKQGFGALKVAKWNSFMRHVANKHKDHPDPLYKECNHRDLEPRKWIKVGEYFVLFVK